MKLIYYYSRAHSLNMKHTPPLVTVLPYSCSNQYQINVVLALLFFTITTSSVNKYLSWSHVY